MGKDQFRKWINAANLKERFAKKKKKKPKADTSTKSKLTEEKKIRDVDNEYWRHDLAFSEWLLDHSGEQELMKLWDLFNDDWDGFPGDEFPSNTHRREVMVNQFKAIKTKGKARAAMKNAVKEGRARIIKEGGMPVHSKVIDFLRQKRELPPRPPYKGARRLEAEPTLRKRVREEKAGGVAVESGNAQQAGRRERQKKQKRESKKKRENAELESAEKEHEEGEQDEEEQAKEEGGQQSKEEESKSAGRAPAPEWQVNNPWALLDGEDVHF